MTGTGGHGINVDSGGGAITIHTIDTVTGSVGDSIESESIEGGDIEGEGIEGDGINAVSGGGDITISAVDTVLGTGGRGIFADSDGGTISIEGVGTTGGVSGTDGHGIQADARGATEGTGGSITIRTTTASSAITGSTSGIHARTDGTDSSITISITTGDVTTTGNSGNSGTGIEAQISNEASASDLTIRTTGAINAVGRGILAGSRGTGGLSITTGDVTSTAHDAIVASSVGITATSDFTIDTREGRIMGARSGIMVVSLASDGAVNIDAGDVTASDGSGILTLVTEATTSVTLTATATVSSSGIGISAESRGGDIIIRGGNTIVGGFRGISADSDGGGDISILDVGVASTITGSSREGIFAQVTGADSSITIDASSSTITGATNGIGAIHAGTGDISISVGEVTGIGGNAIHTTSQAATLVSLVLTPPPEDEMVSLPVQAAEISPFKASE